MFYCQENVATPQVFKPPICSMNARHLRLAVVCLAVGALAPESSARAQFKATDEQMRNEMVDQDIIPAGIKNPGVIESLRKTLRHEFVPPGQRERAYYDMALPIGSGQTISPPFIVAFMTEALDPLPTDKVLEIGTGSGYQAAVLAPLVKDVYTIEIVRPLGEQAAKTLRRLKYQNVHTKIGDGYQGWPEAAPFDKIIVTCSPEKIPQPLIDQLREGGAIVVPLGERYQQQLYIFRKQDGKLVQEALLPVLFVPMTGAAEERREVLPDPANPEIVNGSFEEVAGEPPTAVGWHYQRHCELKRDESTPEGEQHLTFTNSVPGRGAAALQGLSLDGRHLRELELSAWMRIRNVEVGFEKNQSADAALMMYDERRNPAGEISLGPWYGDSEWRQIKRRFIIPNNVREAILRIGLFGGTGQLEIDDLQLKVLKRTDPAATSRH